MEDNLKCAHRDRADAAKRADWRWLAILSRRARRSLNCRMCSSKREGKLAEAQRAQADCCANSARLDDARREFELTVETRVQPRGWKHTHAGPQGCRGETQSQGCGEGANHHSMQRTIEELHEGRARTQQLQGEVQELNRGVAQGQVSRRHHPARAKGEQAGCWPAGGGQWARRAELSLESKRTRIGAMAGWAKLRADQRTAKAEFRSCQSGGFPRGRYLRLRRRRLGNHPRTCFRAVALRHSLIEVRPSDRPTQGQQGKMEMVYQY